MNNTALYDQNTFFENYLELRADENNYNDLYEQPAILELLPPVKGRKVLDLGCGYGPSSVKLHDMGASEVLGIDISSNMIALAKEKNSREGITYEVMGAEDIHPGMAGFDLIFSSLVFHYIEDLPALLRNLHDILNENGELVFSMEHPIVTSTMDQCLCHYDDEGKPDYYMLDNYALEGKRTVEWLDTEITKYHRKTSTVLNMLVDAGFEILRVSEPVPPEEMRERIPRMLQEVHRPSYLLCKCRRR